MFYFLINIWMLLLSEVSSFTLPHNVDHMTKITDPKSKQKVNHFTSRSSSITTNLSQTKSSAINDTKTSIVGVVGRGYISILTAKLAALAGYQTWVLIPPDEEATTNTLLYRTTNAALSNLKLVPSTEVEIIQDSMQDTNALIIAVDDDTPIDTNVIEFLLKPLHQNDGKSDDTASQLKRIVAMSRNLNGKDMGFVVKASKLSANQEVWDGSTTNEYKEFERAIKEQSKLCGADYTIVRGGTLKGGGCGDEEKYDQYLSEIFYEMTKRDIVTWQLLFDCRVRGVSLSKGDVLPGPGMKAILTATGTDALPGDTSRCGLAEAMIRSLGYETTANIDFGVGTKNSRSPPSQEEWETMFQSL